MARALWQPAALGRGAARSSPSAPAQHSRFGASRLPEARAGLSALSVTKDIAKNDLDWFVFFFLNQVTNIY